MPTKKNALKALIVWLNDVFKAVARQLGDVEAKREALRALGLDPAGANQPSALPAGSLASIQQFVDKGDDEVDIEAFVSVLLDALAVAQAIRSFAQIVTNSDDPELLDDFLDMLLQLYLMDAVRLRSGKGDAKAFHETTKAIAMYQELSTASGGVPGLTKSIADFVDRLIHAWDAETADEARLMMDVLFLTLAVVSFKWKPVRDHLRVSYGYDAPPLPSPSPTPNADQIAARTLTAQLRYKFKPDAAAEVEARLLLSFTVRPKNEQGFGFEVLVGGGGTFERKFGDWKFSFAIDGVPEIDLKAKIRVERDGEVPTFHIGDTEGTNLTIGAPSVEVGASLAEQNLDLKVGMKQGGFVLKKGKTDGFLNAIMPENPVYGAFDLGIGYSLKKGLYVDGGSGLTVLVPLHATLGPLLLNAFYLKVTGNSKGDGLAVETSIGMSAKLAGFAASVERIGLIHDLTLPADGKKNLGFVNYGIAFKPPNGVGLYIDAGALKGGGFLYFDPDKGEYFGGLELSFKDTFTLKAIGIINTRMPDGSKGFSMLVIITAEFQPIQLSFGFTLNGVGGLLGVNRTARIVVLKEGIKTNALKSILFPEDIVANMSRIISDLRQVFPPFKDRFLVAPMAKIGWGTPTILTIELGLLFEIPLPRIVILGVLKMALPEDAPEPTLKLQVNFLGIIDFDNKHISFDASLYDSKLLTFTLTGDMALRINWGAQSLFLLSVGGFHPAFREAPADLQNMERLTISLLSGQNPRITAQCYFALTSNTAQFGAKVELYAAAAGFNIYGFVGLDVLFHFDPFSFVAALAAGVALRRGSNVIMGIRVSGQLSGPKPWDVRGEASVSMLFFDVTVPFHETWGQEPDAIAAEVEDLTQRLTAEINDDRNWRSDPPRVSSLHVSVKQSDPPAGKTLVHPFGVLTFSERLLPLNVSIEKFGQKRPKDANRFTIAPTAAGVRSEAATELFAAENFLRLSDKEKLRRPSFEAMPSGFRITSYDALEAPNVVSKSVDYELTYVREERQVSESGGVYKFAKDLFMVSLRGGAMAKSVMSRSSKRTSVNSPEVMEVRPETFEVVHVEDLTPVAQSRPTGSYTEASQQLDAIIGNDPSLTGSIQVISSYERQAA